MLTHRYCAPLLGAALLLAPLAAAQSPPPPEAQYWIGDTISGETLTIEEFGIPAPEQVIRIQLRGGPENFVAGLFVNVAPLEDEVIPPTSLSDPIAITAATDGSGFASVPITVPAGLPAGTMLDFQWATIDPITSEILFSEVLRVRTMDAPRTLHTSYDAEVDVKLAGGFGGDGVLELSGSVALDLSPGPSAETMIATVSDVSLNGDGGELGSGIETGQINVRLVEAVSAVVEFNGRYDFSMPAELEVWYEGLALDPDHPEWIAGDVEETPMPLRIAGTLTLQHDLTGGNDGQFVFVPDIVQDPEAFDTYVTIDGRYDAETLPYDVSDKVRKKLIKVCVVIIRNSDGTAPACTPAEAAARIAEADRLFCEQCCIRIQQDGPVRYVNSTNFQSMNFADRTAFINANNTPCLEVVFSSSITGTATGVTRGGKSNDPTVFVGNEGNLNTTAHEMGHALGLGHRGSGSELMKPTADPAKKDLNKGECDKARGKAGLECLEEWCEPMPQG